MHSLLLAHYFILDYFFNCNTHSGPSSGIATWATLKTLLTDWLIGYKYNLYSHQ